MASERSSTPKRRRVAEPVSLWGTLPTDLQKKVLGFQSEFEYARLVSVYKTEWDNPIHLDEPDENYHGFTVLSNESRGTDAVDGPTSDIVCFARNIAMEVSRQELFILELLDMSDEYGDGQETPMLHLWTTNNAERDLLHFQRLLENEVVPSFIRLVKRHSLFPDMTRVEWAIVADQMKDYVELNREFNELVTEPPKPILNAAWAKLLGAFDK